MNLVLWAIATQTTAAAGVVTGRVTGPNGAPIEDCTITVVNPRLEAARTTTDADGAYVFPTLPAGHYRISAAPGEADPHLARYHPNARGYCEGETIAIRGVHTAATADFTLPLGAEITGQIQDLDGESIAGAGVIVVPRDAPGVSRFGHTDTQGRFVVPGLDVANGGAQEWSVQVGVSGWPVQWLGAVYPADDAIVFPLNAEHATDVGTHQLLDGIFVAGTVSDEHGPIADATVRVYSNSQLVQTNTDANGDYEVSGLPPGEVLPWVSAELHGVTYYPDVDRPISAIDALEEGDVLTKANLTMPAEAIFYGQVFIDEMVIEDQAISVSEISVLLYNDTHTVGRGAQVEADGSFTIDQLHGGEYNLFVYARNAGLADAWVRDEDGDYRSYTVEPAVANAVVKVPVAAAVRVEGTVLDEDGVPVANAVVLLTDAAADGPAEQAESARLTHTDGAGEYAVVGLPPGEWDLRVIVDPTCQGDPGFVPIYYPQQIEPKLWESIVLFEGDPPFIARFDLPRDDDYDLLSDKWERRYDLDTTRDDSTEDPDKDGLSNLDEYRRGLDPRTADGVWVTVHQCGCAASRAPVGAWVYAVLTLIGISRRRREPGAKGYRNSG